MRKAISTDGLPEREATAVANSIYGRDARPPSHGRNGNITYTYNGTRPPAPAPRPAPVPVVAAGAYDTSDVVELPTPIEDGTIHFLQSVFSPGDKISIASEIYTEDGNNIPDGRGTTFERDQLINLIDQRGNGDPTEVWGGSRTGGIFVRVNAMMEDGDSDHECAKFRYALLEWDHIPVEQQWALILKSEIPCACVIHSGGNSLHAWVKVDAQDREEFEERVLVLHDHFAAYDPDAANKNPSRFSRLPGALRQQYPDRAQGRRQDLLALNIGVPDWAEWLEVLKDADLPPMQHPQDMYDIDTDNDPNALLGARRWMCKGSGALIIGSSGIGKSSLAMQLGVRLATGQHFFGAPVMRPLRVLIIQAENNDGDISEEYKGVRHGMNLDEEEWGLVCNNLRTIRDTSSAGHQFIARCERYVRKFQAEVIIADPLVSFVGGDVSKQEVIGGFLRQGGLNDMLVRTNVMFFWVHHTGKPPKDVEMNMSLGDYSYIGLGSSDLTNWARAIIVLKEDGKRLNPETQEEHRVFSLIVPKRGERAGLRDFENRPVRSKLHLKHGDSGIVWELCPGPDEAPERNSRNPQRETNGYRIAEVNFEVSEQEIRNMIEMAVSDGLSAPVAVYRVMQDYQDNYPGVTCAHIWDRIGGPPEGVTERVRLTASYMIGTGLDMPESVSLACIQWAAGAQTAAGVRNRFLADE